MIFLASIRNIYANVSHVMSSSFSTWPYQPLPPQKNDGGVEISSSSWCFWTCGRIWSGAAEGIPNEERRQTYLCRKRRKYMHKKKKISCYFHLHNTLSSKWIWPKKERRRCKKRRMTGRNRHLFSFFISTDFFLFCMHEKGKWILI